MLKEQQIQKKKKISVVYLEPTFFMVPFTINEKENQYSHYGKQYEMPQNLK